MSGLHELNEAFDRLNEVLEKQSALVMQFGEDIDRLVEVFGKIKVLANSEPKKSKSYASPYAKFDKYHKKKRK